MEVPFKIPEDWFEHVATLRLKKHVAETQAIAFNALLAACASSTDPKVRQLHSSFVVLGDMVSMMTKDPAQKDDEDDE